MKRITVLNRVHDTHFSNGVKIYRMLYRGELVAWTGDYKNLYKEDFIEVVW